MKHLYLLRHAKSSWKHPELIDLERPLNKRGKRDAPVMGQRLKKMGVKPDLILTSPARRAMKTARIIAREIGYRKNKIARASILYEGSLPDLVKMIRNLEDEYEEVLLCGHNPELTHLADALSRGSVANIPTCGIYCLEFAIESWKNLTEGTGVLRFFDYPKKSPS